MCTLSCSMVSGPSSDPLVLHDEVFSVDAHPPCLPASPPCPGDDDVVDMHVEHVVRPVQPVSFVEECIEVEPSSSHVFIALSAAMAEADESTHFVPTNKPEKEDLALINKFIKEFGEGGTKSTGKSRKKLKIEEGKHIKENRKDRAARKVASPHAFYRAVPLPPSPVPVQRGVHSLRHRALAEALIMSGKLPRCYHNNIITMCVLSS